MAITNELKSGTLEVPAHRLRWLALLPIGLALLMTVLDCTILNVALPTIQKELNATSSQLLWMVNAYTMIFGALMLTAGALGDRIGRARLLQAGVAVFGLASLGAYLSTSAGRLIMWRVLQGAGAAMLVPATLAIITNVFPEGERSKAIGVWAGIQGVGIALGPIIGGALVQNSSWSAIFLINVPVSAVALVLGWFLVPDSRDERPRKLDIIGNLLSLSSLASLIFGFINAASQGAAAPVTLISLAAFAVLAAGFILWERRQKEPLLEIDFFGNPRFTAGIATMVIVGLGLNGVQYVSTYYMQFVQGYSALSTGLRYLPLAIGLIIGSVTADRAVRALGTKAVMALGFLGAAVVLVLASRFSAHSPYWQLGVEFALIGFSLGYVMTPVTEAIMGAVPKAKAGIGSAMNSVFRTFSGAIGVASLGALAGGVYTFSFLKSGMTAGLTADLARQAGESVGAAMKIAGSGQLPSSVSVALAQSARESFMAGWSIMAVVSAVLFVVGAVLVIRFMPSRAPAESPVSRLPKSGR